ncbi:zinc-binding dehydrogenase [Protaetiibacter larvae]|uniref:Zinc-binding dehydrogenase n=1 Tax=Protaetiibacter larvae TaxID=2592654 RepID=A0A5C1Y7Y5_9MICO|nr:zinc-binding dehydrogenase [Protaetiibacter larvae]QEO10213.1 zinc-binding dehydrogenase [Protaetiibacter larvae]
MPGAGDPRLGGLDGRHGLAGDYLLHPFRGFITGYDVVGVLESLDADATRQGLAVGQRVAAVVPDMGAHASIVVLPGSLLVAVPDGLDSSLAAALPLDLMTARLALSCLRPDARSVLVQGVTGAVGLLAAQLALPAGLRVAGTASQRTAAIEPLAVHLVDYRDASWRERVREEFGPVDGVIDHTGDRALGRLLSDRGRIVRISYAGRRGHQKGATLRGSIRTLLHHGIPPRERLAATPASIRGDHGRYRAQLGELLERVARGELRPVEPELHPFADFATALRAADRGLSGRKAVLRMP